MRPTAPLFRRLRRLALTTKSANKGFYKGTRSGAMGTHTKHGGYIIDPFKVRTYVVPKDLDDFPLKPYVTKKLEPTKGSFPSGPSNPHGSPVSGAAYFDRWTDTREYQAFQRYQERVRAGEIRGPRSVVEGSGFEVPAFEAQELQGDGDLVQSDQARLDTKGQGSKSPE